MEAVALPWVAWLWQFSHRVLLRVVSAEGAWIEWASAVPLVPLVPVWQPAQVEPRPVMECGMP